MAEPQLVLWTESDNGPRFGVDTDGIAAAGGVFRSVRCRDEAERIAAARDARVMVVGGAAITDAVYAGAPRLVGIVRTGIGLDTVDIPAATRHGVCISHVPDFCYDEVADTAWALILAVTRKVVLADRHVRAGEWAPGAVMPVHTLRGQTLGLVAFGHIARKVAERARGFGVRIIAADPYVDAAAMRAEGVEKVSLDDLLAQADIVSLHTPLTPETRGMLGAAGFGRMKPGAVLINTSRGGVVDQAALIEALRSGRLSGAGLDVQIPEPPSKDTPLLQMDNVVLTPHYASTTVEAMRDLAAKVSRQVIQFLRGEWPTYLANPAVREQSGCRLVARRGAAR
ncbi:MAG TPA: C-terminal binding protein [bacterium]|nr:C-terminal binding protein [bacterium]